MVFFERYQNIGVACSDKARCAVHEIDGAVGQADIVQDVVHLALGNLTPNRAFDEIAQLRGLFDPRAALGSEMEDELTAVRIRKEVLTKPRHQEKCRGAGQKKDGDEEDPPMDEHCEQGLVGIPKPFEPALECSLEPHE